MEQDKKKIRVLIMSEYFYPDHAATPKLLTELAEDLIEQGICVEVMTSRNSYKNQHSDLSAKDTYKGIIIKRVISSDFNRDKFLGRLINYLTFIISIFFKVIFKRDYDVMLLVSNPPILPIIGWLANKIHKKPYVYLLHDIYPDIAVKVGAIKEGSLLFNLMSKLNSKIFKSAKKVIVLGRDMEANILAKGIAKQKIEIITNWADKTKIYPLEKANDFAKKHGLTNSFNIMYTGNIGRFHDIETILNVAKIMGNNEKVKFVFVGEGYKKQLIYDFVDKYQLKNIDILTYQYGEAYNQLLNAADLFISTLDSGIEGLGVPSKTYSYLAASKPLIGIMNAESEIGNLIIKNNIGLRVDSGNSEEIATFIQNMQADNNMYQEMIKNVKSTFSNNYERKIVTKKFADVLEKASQ